MKGKFWGSHMMTQRIRRGKVTMKEIRRDNEKIAQVECIKNKTKTNA
jgi:hypothetical protein